MVAPIVNSLGDLVGALANKTVTEIGKPLRETVGNSDFIGNSLGTIAVSMAKGDPVGAVDSVIKEVGSEIKKQTEEFNKLVEENNKQSGSQVPPEPVDEIISKVTESGPEIASQIISMLVGQTLKKKTKKRPRKTTTKGTPKKAPRRPSTKKRGKSQKMKS